jgi:hypothetical protein
LAAIVPVHFRGRSPLATPPNLFLSLAALSSAQSSQSKEASDKKKILCVGAHPDDPESGCGGTLAKLARIMVTT